MKRLIWSAVVLAALPALAEDGPEDRIFFHTMRPGHGPGGPPLDHVMVLGAEEGFELKTVKGAPYQAESVTEVVQTLADGNRITRRTTATVARDGEGRVRRETRFGGLGPMAGGDGPKLVFVHDPVARTGFVLHADDKTARRLPPPPDEVGDSEAPERGRGDAMRTRLHARGAAVSKAFPEGQKEDLGTQTIEGVEAQGTRTTHTIPAGEIGNEKPLRIVHERWYSPELQTLVMSRSADPRMGETTFRLTNIQRGEPDRSLFEIPEDYKVVEGGAMFHKRIRKVVE
ncbi:MAG TPA: hypothetical protein VFM88_16725 [Vicinamibacteria bacterium]|nr:hypothetical protein [Vicinamibacteria bacterium]